MKRLPIYLVLISTSLFAINADIKTYVFQSDNNGFVEIIYYIPTHNLKKNYKPSVVGNSIAHDSSFQFQVMIDITMKKDDSIVKTETILLSSPFLTEERALLHQFRWSVNPGSYTLESKLQDTYNPIDELSYINNFEVRIDDQKIQLSPIQLFRTVKNINNSNSTLYKHGFEYEPVPFLLIDKKQNLLYSYCEVYNLSTYNQKNYGVKYELFNNSESGKIKLEEWLKSKSTVDAGILLNHKDISELPSGKYSLSISLIDRQGSKIDSNSIDFERSNPFWDRLQTMQIENQKGEAIFKEMSNDSVDYYLKALNVILPSVEKVNISSLNEKNKMTEKRMYLYRFWKDRFDTACAAKFNKFQKNVEFADRNFPTGFGHGFESDRGRIYLKYGPPTELISDNQDNGAFPYEIWIYNQLPNGQSDVKFLFYNKDLTETNYLLLHSTCIGERSNKQWEIQLYRRVREEFDGENQVEATRIKRSVSRRARDYFDE